MQRLKYLACAMALAAAACGGNDNQLTNPTPGNPTTIDFTDAINGPLTPNGSQTFTFSTLATGNIAATLITLNPDGPSPPDGIAQKVGLALGVPDSTGACQRVVYNDHLLLSTSINATATQPGTFCVTIFDATGTLMRPQTFDIRVQHP
jgi:hypothetical protein